MERIPITTRPATSADIRTIQSLAEEIWWPTYSPFLDKAQIAYMLQALFSNEKIISDMDKGLSYIISYANHGQDATGFAVYGPKEDQEYTSRIDKLYILPSKQGMGCGKLLLDHISLQNPQAHLLELNVNRNNEKAIRFYQRQGFAITQSVDISWHGYILNDHIMQKAI